jgi:hypothetical protein
MATLQNGFGIGMEEITINHHHPLTPVDQVKRDIKRQEAAHGKH